MTSSCLVRVPTFKRASLISVGALTVMAEMRNQGVTFSKDTYTLACATCYKLVSNLGIAPYLFNLHNKRL